METVTDFILGAPKSPQILAVAMKIKMLAPWKKSYDRLRQHVKKTGTLLCQQRSVKQHSWLSPLCIGQAQVEAKTYKRRSQSALSLFLSCVCELFLSLSLSLSSTLFPSSLSVGMPSCFEDGFSCYLLSKIEL